MLPFQREQSPFEINDGIEIRQSWPLSSFGDRRTNTGGTTELCALLFCQVPEYCSRSNGRFLQAQNVSL
ncbi:hypothetical protein P0D73_46015, partial [Paraburkholderia sp. RL18-101-BIB-B]|uniref:hypothetical protein n=1 Tax=Paraburkholderia sp. RL18-101-BIB-B TaxID=3031634 RepID=UPI0038B888CB